jgi:hypothetical protein
MLTTMLVMSCSLGPQGPSPDDPRFAAPVRLKADDGWVRVESPGYAAPCWHDVNGDGKKDLIVGQFKGGKMRVYDRQASGTFAAPKWLEAEGAIAEVPGVW